MPPAEITICVLLYEFQKRLWWMLSSLAQQEAWRGQPVPKFTIRLSTCRGDAHWGLTWRLKSVLGELLAIDVCEYRNDTFNFRGRVRDRDARAASTEWLLFSDADTLYHPQFWARLAAGYMADLPAGQFMLACTRDKLQRDDSYRLVDSVAYEDQPVPDAYARAHKAWRANPGPQSRATGIGYFQLCRRQAVLDRGGYVLDSDVPESSFLITDGKWGQSDTNFQKGWQIVPIEGLPERLLLQHLHRNRPGWYEHCR